MPVEAKPLFRPDVLRAHLAGFALPAHVEGFRPKLAHWAELLASGKANTFTEQEILPDVLTDFFCELLGYTRPADGGTRYTISREKHVQVEGEFADAVLGDFGRGPERFIVALEGKGPRDPLDRPFGGRRMSAVDQGYRYAINLPCDWIIVTSLRQTRLYGKGTDQQTTRRQLLDWLRVEHDVAKPTLKLKALLDLDSNAFVAEVRKVRGRKRPLTSAALANLRDEHARSIAPLRPLATEALRLEHHLSDLVNAAYHLTPDEIALLWQTAPPRMPIGGLRE